MNPTDLRDALEADPTLRKSLGASNTLNAPTLLDLLFWNVVISFVVNVTASAVYDQIRRLFASDEVLTARDLAKVAGLLKQPVEGYDPARVDGAVRAAARLLEDQGVPAAEEAVQRAVQTASRPT